MVKLLLDHGAATAEDERGNTSLKWAELRKDADMVKLLLNHGAPDEEYERSLQALEKILELSIGSNEWRRSEIIETLKSYKSRQIELEPES